MRPLAAGGAAVPATRRDAPVRRAGLDRHTTDRQHRRETEGRRDRGHPAPVGTGEQWKHAIGEKWTFLKDGPGVFKKKKKFFFCLLHFFFF